RDVESAKFNMDALDEFKSIYALVPSIAKSKGEMKRGKAKVAWNSVCLPKQKGGLGFLLSNVVYDIILIGGLAWSLSLYTRAQVLYNCIVYALSHDCKDRLVQKDLHGNEKQLSVHAVWDVIRPRGNETDDELTEKELKHIEADNQAIQTILLGLPEDIHVAVDSCETAQEIWLRVQQMMKGSNIGIQEKKAKFFNEWKRMESTCYHCSSNKGLAYSRLHSIIDCSKGRSKIQLQAEEFNLMAVAADLDEIEEVNSNCILMANLQQASTSGTQTDKAPVYDSDGSAEVHKYEDCYDNDIFNMFTQEEQYTELLEPISESHQEPQNDNNVISEVTSMEQSRGTVEQHPANFEETHNQKAHNTIDWGFLRSFLIDFGFHLTMVNWIMECVTSTSFSLTINGPLHGYVKGKWGLCQGDPVGDVESAKYNMDALDEIISIHALVSSIAKSKGEMKRGKAKVAWNSVCLPKQEGGLGWNFWNVPPRSGMIWGWRKILHLSDLVRPFVWSVLGNGFLLSNVVYDIILIGGLAWSLSWYTRAQVLYNCIVYALSHDCKDRLVQKDLHGNEK
nr:hypothetical protein [Tanacetum cinerariifolium]